MRIVYLLSVWLHLLAAMLWVGGMLFLVGVVVPVLRTKDRAAAAVLLRETGGRYRTLAWASFAVLLGTGSLNLGIRGIGWTELGSPAWLGSPMGRLVAIKLSLFTLIVTLAAVHDFFVGPRATAAMMADPHSGRTERLRLLASWMGRVTLLLALAVVFVGVAIVRGGW